MGDLSYPRGHTVTPFVCRECDNRVVSSINKVFYHLQTEVTPAPCHTPATPLLDPTPFHVLQVYQLSSHCSINLVDEALVEMQGQTVTTKDLPWSLLQKNLSVVCACVSVVWCVVCMCVRAW